MPTLFSKLRYPEGECMAANGQLTREAITNKIQCVYNGDAYAYIRAVKKGQETVLHSKNNIFDVLFFAVCEIEEEGLQEGPGLVALKFLSHSDDLYAHLERLYATSEAKFLVNALIALECIDSAKENHELIRRGMIHTAHQITTGL